jgi:hypothetical protein
MPTLIIPTYSNEDDLTFLVLNLNPEDLQTLERLHDVHLTLAAGINDALCPEARTAGMFSEFSVSLGWSNIAPDWYEYPDDEDLQEALSEALDETEIMTLAEPPAGLGEPARTESDHLHVDHKGFWFTTYRRHSGTRVDSYDIPWAFLATLSP